MAPRPADATAALAELARGLGSLEHPELRQAMRSALGVADDADLSEEMGLLATRLVRATEGDVQARQALSSLGPSAPPIESAAAEAVLQSLHADGGAELLEVLGDVSRGAGNPEVDQQALLDRLYAVLPEVELAEATVDRERIQAEVKADLDDLFADFSLPSLGEAGKS